MNKIHGVIVALLVMLLMASSASAAASGINKNIVDRVDYAQAHADVWTDSAAPVASEVGEVTVVSDNGDASILLTYRDPSTLTWWYTFDDTGMYKFYPLAKGDFVYGENTASVNAKQVPIKNTANLSQVQYIDVSINWAKQPNGIVYSENGKPINGVKMNVNYYDAVATGSDGAFSQVYGVQGVGSYNWWCSVYSTKGFVKA